jgi:glutamate formiminotransferase/formiminotetrahydrofolate cyclodeaminase
MKQPIVECIPNFSEGRREEVVAAIEQAIEAVPGAMLLDRHMDADHNRSVITFAGPPQAVLEGAFAAIASAAELIDLNKHQGEHPRIGATDVVPFVPIQDVSMEECVELARELGRRVAHTLNIPVYLYEKAATRPERENLANLRRGEYEGLKAAIGQDPERAPDFGPKELGPAGAVVIGARVPLIAYNVYLGSGEVAIAQEIARTVRHSSGGYRYVKALGMLVDGQAQVSMNMTDFERTPLAPVVEHIRREAQRHGVQVTRSELVGLIPQAALIEAARWYLQLDDFEPDQVLETRMFAAAREPGPDRFLAELASGEPTPGGGSAAAYAGAMAASLVAMVARVTLGKKKYATVEDEMKGILEMAEALRVRQENSVALDAQAFEGVLQALRLPKSSEAEQATRAIAIREATIRATEVPLQVCRDAVATLALAKEVAHSGNVNAISDAGSAGAMAGACVSAAAMNVRINAKDLDGSAPGAGWLDELKTLEAAALEHQQALRDAIKERAGF